MNGNNVHRGSSFQIGEVFRFCVHIYIYINFPILGIMHFESKTLWPYIFVFTFFNVILHV